MVLLFLHALQGHPKSGALRANHISGILSELGFTAMIHALCIFKGMIDGKEVLIFKQDDDFQIAAADRSTIDHVINQIGGRVRFIGNDVLMTKFNGS